MLLETLIAVPLPVRWQSLPPAHWLEGVQNVLLSGDWKTRTGTCEVDSGAVLAGLYAAARQLSPHGKLLLGRGGDEILNAVDLSKPLPDLGSLPDGWQQGLSDGTLTLQGRTATLEFTLQGRFLNRVKRQEPALRLVLRAIARAVMPEDPRSPALPEPPASETPAPWDESYEQELRAWFQHPQHFAQLRAHLMHEGERQTRTLETALAPLLQRSPEGSSLELLPRVLVLPSLTGLEGMLSGFSPAGRRCLEGIAREFMRRRPSMAAVYCREPDGSLMIWRGHDFVREGRA